MQTIEEVKGRGIAGLWCRALCGDCAAPSWLDVVVAVAGGCVMLAPVSYSCRPFRAWADGRACASLPGGESRRSGGKMYGHWDVVGLMAAAVDILLALKVR